MTLPLLYCQAQTQKIACKFTASGVDLRIAEKTVAHENRFKEVRNFKFCDDFSSCHLMRVKLCTVSVPAKMYRKFKLLVSEWSPLPLQPFNKIHQGCRKASFLEGSMKEYK